MQTSKFSEMREMFRPSFRAFGADRARERAGRNFSHLRKFCKSYIWLIWGCSFHFCSRLSDLSKQWISDQPFSSRAKNEHRICMGTKFTQQTIVAVASGERLPAKATVESSSSKVLLGDSTLPFDKRRSLCRYSDDS